MTANDALHLFGVQPDDPPGVVAEKVRAHVCASHLCAQDCQNPPCPWRHGGEAWAALAVIIREVKR